MNARRKQAPSRKKRVEPHFGTRRKSPQGRPKRRPARRTRRKRTFLARTLRVVAFACLWGALVLGAGITYYVSGLPDPVLAALDDRPPNLTVLATDGTVLAERGLRRGHVRLDVLPPYLTKAVLATEDRRFYYHFGVDPIGLARATLANIAAGGVVEGGSTVTQQLAKNLFLKPERTIARKIEEAIYAVWLERRFAKDEILELYLNRVYFGGGTYGVEAASRHYFGKSARFVTLPEAALLAGLLKAPSRYAPTRNAKLAGARVDEVLENMVEAGFLTPVEAGAAGKQTIRLRAVGDETGYPYAVDWVAELLPNHADDNEGDLIVETTIDANLQRNAQKALRTTLDGEGALKNAHEGAVVVLDPTGGVKALVGGRSYKASPFDRAIKSLRQPGSAFKPFVYLAALESGYTPDSMAYDEPVKVAGWTPKNYTGRYRGQVSLRDGLAKSINTVAVRLAADVENWRVIRAARRLGIRAALHDNPSLALGTSEVTLLELTGAYAAFANGGFAVPPHIITRVRNGNGKVLYQRPAPRPQQAIALPYVAAMNDMMNAVVVYGTGKRAGIPDHAAGGKTGTSQDFRDAWFVGYTAHYVTGVWMGNDNGEGMKRVTGGSLPATVWHDIMLEAHKDKTPLPLPGTHRPMFEETVARLPGPAPSSPQTEEKPLFSRILGIFGGG